MLAEMPDTPSPETHRQRFEEAVVVHLPAAYNLARWMLRDEHSAEDVVQEAFVRALRFYRDLRGADARPWVLGIVRNACYDWLRQGALRQGEQHLDPAQDDELEWPDDHPGAADPARQWEQQALKTRVHEAIRRLAPAFREVIVLREIEEMPYEEIARVAGVPVGTVMSRLSRARAQLRQWLQADAPPSWRAKES